MQSTDKKTLKVSEVLVNTLNNLGVETVFGYPGSAVLSVYDALSKQINIKHYLLRHEQSAVHAAEGCARVSGKCGVVIVTSGPGASNAVTGIANAYLDGFPLLVISGQVSSEFLGKDAFQEINFSEMVKTCTKAVFKVTSADELESTLMQAYLIAETGKKGPVVIDIPKDILSSEAEYKKLALPLDKIADVNDIDIENTSEILKNSSSPVVVCGGGVLHSGASHELSKLVEFLKIPVVSTIMGTGAFSQTHPFYAGMIGLYGDEHANDLIKSADTLLILGARFNDRVSSAFDKDILNSKTIIQVDINSKELLRNLRSDLAVNSDIKIFLNALISKMSAIESVKYEYNFNADTTQKRDNGKMQMSDVVKALYSYTKDFSPIIAAEVGQHQISLIKNYKFDKPRKLLTSGGLGTMGFGFPAAIGASIAIGRKPVVLVTGDGSFQMNLTELAVCLQYKIPVKILVINNGYLGMVRQLQQEQCESRFYETALNSPDFVMLAKSYGIKAVRVDKQSQINSVLQNAFISDEPYLIEFVTDSYENV